MGFLDENGELFLVGRLKDIITLQGPRCILKT